MQMSITTDSHSEIAVVDFEERVISLGNAIAVSRISNGLNDDHKRESLLLASF